MMNVFKGTRVMIVEVGLAAVAYSELPFVSASLPTLYVISVSFPGRNTRVEQACDPSFLGGHIWIKSYLASL